MQQKQRNAPHMTQRLASTSEQGAMDMQSGNERYYAYLLKEPNDDVFYVGKGTEYVDGSYDRINDHFRYAENNSDHNKAKMAKIQSIHARGEEVKREKIYFESELDAYMYEWALTNMTTYAERLTNLYRGPGAYVPRSPVVFPELDTPPCIQRGKGKVHHQIADLETFARRHSINSEKMKALVEGQIAAYSNWHIVRRCPCLLSPETLLDERKRLIYMLREATLLLENATTLPNIEATANRRTWKQRRDCLITDIDGFLSKL